MNSNFNIIEDYDYNIIIKPSIKKRSRLLCEEKKTKYIIDKNKLNKLIDTFDKNKYINMKDNGKDYNSISYIINKSLSHSQCIKFGIIMEKYLLDIILENNYNLKNIKPKRKNGNKEKDHLLLDSKNKIIHYSEIKSNLNLDTEKSKETSCKCLKIYNELCKEYFGYKVNMYLVGIRYNNISKIPKNIINKYENIKDHVVGINEYFFNLNVNIEMNETEYSILINSVVDKCFN